jgi:hypothetical protein
MANNTSQHILMELHINAQDTSHALSDCTRRKLPTERRSNPCRFHRSTGGLNIEQAQMRQWGTAVLYTLLTK